jgi:hypothetical protein
MYYGAHESCPFNVVELISEQKGKRGGLCDPITLSVSWFLYTESIQIKGSYFKPLFFLRIPLGSLPLPDFSLSDNTKMAPKKTLSKNSLIIYHRKSYKKENTIE